MRSTASTMPQTSPDRSPEELDAAYALAELQREARVFNDEMKAARALTDISRECAKISKEAAKERNAAQPKTASPTDSLLLTNDSRETINSNRHSVSCLSSQDLGKTIGKKPSFERAEDAIRRNRRRKSILLPGECFSHSMEVQVSFRPLLLPKQRSLEIY